MQDFGIALVRLEINKGRVVFGVESGKEKY